MMNRNIRYFAIGKKQDYKKESPYIYQVYNDPENKENI